MGTVKLTQFVHQEGNRKETSVELPDDVCEMAKDQVLSCEMMPNDYSKVVFYSRKKEWEEEDEDCEIAVNGPGDNSQKNDLDRLVRRVNHRFRLWLANYDLRAKVVVKNTKKN